MGIISSARNWLGQLVAGTGQALNLRKVGGGQGLGAKIAGRAKQYPSVHDIQPVLRGPGAKPPPPTASSTAPPTGGQPTPPPSQGQPEQRQEQQYQVPSVTDYVPSAEEAAQRAAEEKARVQQEKMNRFGELITPLRGDVESYLKSRRPITELFQEEMTKQGITGKQEALGTLEREATKLGEQIETLPNEEIARRKETGMLTAQAERRIRAMEERPIREQLLKVTGAKESERVGLQRAYELLDKMLDMEREQEKRGQEPLNYRLKGAEEQFGFEGEGFKSEIDSIATKLSGFNKDREAKLKEYETTVDAGIQLSLQQEKEAAALKRMELEHLNTMDQISARETGQKMSGIDPEILEEVKAKLRKKGADPQKILKDYTGVLSDEVLKKIISSEAGLQRDFNIIKPKRKP